MHQLILIVSSVNWRRKFTVRELSFNYNYDDGCCSILCILFERANATWPPAIQNDTVHL